jgi:hypothetical protein
MASGSGGWKKYNKGVKKGIIPKRSYGQTKASQRAQPEFSFGSK